MRWFQHLLPVRLEMRYRVACAAPIVLGAGCTPSVTPSATPVVAPPTAPSPATPSPQIVAVSLADPPVLTPEGNSPGLDDGSFLIGELLPGRYEIQVQRDGVRVAGQVVELTLDALDTLVFLALPEASPGPGGSPGPTPSG